MLLLLFAGIVFICTDLLAGQAGARPLANVRVTVTPAKATLYAGETQSFAAKVVGIEDQSVSWSVEEEEGGSISISGLYTAPKLQGVYHIRATSRSRPQKKAVATVTVLAYCDPFPAVPRR